MGQHTPEPWLIAEGNFIVAHCLSDSPSSGLVVAEVPCTLQFIRGEGMLPGITRPKNRVDQFGREMRDTMDDAVRAIEGLKAKIEGLAITGKAKKELLDAVETALREMGPNVKFVARQFGEHCETTIEKAKIEIAAYMESAVHRLGLRAAQDMPFALTEGTSDDRGE